MKIAARIGAAISEGGWGRGVSAMLSAGSIVTSFALMACCALPLLLVSVGLAGAWTLRLQTTLGPHEQILLALAIGFLGLGTLAWVSQVWSACTARKPPCRLVHLALTPVMLLIGAGFTWLGLHPG